MDHHHHLTRRYLLPVLLLLLIAYRARPEVNDVSVTAAEEAEKTGPEMSLVERAIGITTTAFNSRWDAIRTWAKLSWMSLQPPVSHLLWLKSVLTRRGSSPGEVAKKAAARSFEASKETLAGTAKSAADVAGEVVEKTTEKVKGTVSTPSEDETNAEL